MAVGSAPTDFFGTGGLMINDGPSPVTRLFGGTVAEHEHQMRLASPLSHVRQDAPPFLIAHGTLDEIVPFDQAERLAAALGAAGADVELVVRAGAYHNWNASPDSTFPDVGYWDLGPLVVRSLEKHLHP